MSEQLETSPRLEDISTEVINCPSCGLTIHADVERCPGCGTDVASESSPSLGLSRRAATFLLVPAIIMLAAYLFMTAIWPYIYR